MPVVSFSMISLAPFFAASRDLNLTSFRFRIVGGYEFARPSKNEGTHKKKSSRERPSSGRDAQPRITSSPSIPSGSSVGCSYTEPHESQRCELPAHEEIYRVLPRTPGGAMERGVTPVGGRYPAL